MRKLVLASHGDLAKGMKQSVEMILGSFECDVEIYGLQHGQIANDYAKQLELEVKANPKREFIIVTDLYGASVASAMLPLSLYNNVVVFSGMCTSLILTLVLTYKEKLDEKAISEILNQSKEGLRVIRVENSTNEMEDF